ncbi:hypothetical protein [Propionivibrio limicola]|uniref:hypothetical protein n=1 Tax=Propionivibrio limicola TaxID=167645 RepID=UPI001291787D|nr:hypothetical protein [Propionivibrio limicola]
MRKFMAMILALSFSVPVFAAMDCAEFSQAAAKVAQKSGEYGGAEKAVDKLYPNMDKQVRGTLVAIAGNAIEQSIGYEFIAPMNHGMCLSFNRSGGRVPSGLPSELSKKKYVDMAINACKNTTNGVERSECVKNIFEAALDNAIEFVNRGGK